MVDCRLRPTLSVHETRHERERLRGAGQQSAVRSRLRACRRHERDFGRAVQPASTCLHRPRGRASATRRCFDILDSYIRLPHLLLSHLCDRQRFAGAWSTPTNGAATIWTRRLASIKPGITTADVVKLWPKAEEFGFPDEEAAFPLQYGHGVGFSIWEKPTCSRLVSPDHPEVIEEGMAFALETFWPALRRLVRVSTSKKQWW